MSRLLFLVALAPLLASCNETIVKAGTNEKDAAPPPEEERPPVVSDEPPDAPSEGGSCNALEQIGQKYRLHETTAAPPVPTGGAIEDGVYVGVAGMLYGPSLKEGRYAGTAHPQTMAFANGETQIVEGDPPAVRSSGIFSTNGSEMRLIMKCRYPEAAGAIDSISDTTYSAEGGTLRIFTTKGGVTQELAYEKR